MASTIHVNRAYTCSRIPIGAFSVRSRICRFDPHQKHLTYEDGGWRWLPIAVSRELEGQGIVPHAFVKVPLPANVSACSRLLLCNSIYCEGNLNALRLSVWLTLVWCASFLWVGLFAWFTKVGVLDHDYRCVHGLWQVAYTLKKRKARA